MLCVEEIGLNFASVVWKMEWDGVRVRFVPFMLWIFFFFSVGAGMEGKLYIGSKHLHIEEGRGRNRGSVRMRRWVLSTSPHLALRGTSRPILTPDVVAFTTQGKQLWFHFPVPNVPSPTPTTPLLLSTHTHAILSRSPLLTRHLSVHADDDTGGTHIHSRSVSSAANTHTPLLSYICMTTTCSLCVLLTILCLTVQACERGKRWLYLWCPVT